MTRPAGVAAGLPDFPWDLLEPAKVRSAQHPGGAVDLSTGTPVDPVPPSVREALAAAANSPGYPSTAGSAALGSALRSYLSRRCGVSLPPSGVLPTIGSKELVAGLPTLLGLGPGDAVMIPSIGYPTYEVGARMAGAAVLRANSPQELPGGATAATPVRLVWLNSPANPHGRVLSAAEIAAVVGWAREVGAVVASDECYLELGWEAEPVSVLSNAVCGDCVDGVLMVGSLSKRSNLAGYRAGFVAGDPALIGELLQVRKHLGLIVPAPVQAAMVAALADDTHVGQQRARYQTRRQQLWTALSAAGFRIDHSQAGLYLWATRGEDGWATAEWFAERGIVVAPGSFYGPAGASHVRLALTATDERIAAACERLTS